MDLATIHTKDKASEKLEAEEVGVNMKDTDPPANKPDDMSPEEVKEIGIENTDPTTTNHACSENLESEAVEVVGADVTDVEEVGTTFTCFPRLPAELRVRVWNFHIGNGGRFVELQFGRRSELRPGCDESQFLWTSPTSLPTILKINKESRHEGLKIYKLSFGSSPELYSIPATTYFNPSIDTVYLDRETIYSWQGVSSWECLPEDIRRAPSLALDSSLIQNCVKGDPLQIKTSDRHNSCWSLNLRYVWTLNYRGPLWLKHFKYVFNNLDELYIIHEMEKPPCILDPRYEWDNLNPNGDCEITKTRRQFRRCFNRRYDDLDENHQRYSLRTRGVWETSWEQKHYPTPMVKSMKRYIGGDAWGENRKTVWVEVPNIGEKEMSNMWNIPGLLLRDEPGDSKFIMGGPEDSERDEDPDRELSRPLYGRGPRYQGGR